MILNRYFAISDLMEQGELNEPRILSLKVIVAIGIIQWSIRENVNPDTSWARVEKWERDFKA